MRTREKRGCKTNKVWIGLLILLAGAVLLLRQMGFLLEPSWLFTWPMILIIVGIFTGFGTRFRDISWVILIAVGVFFLIDDIVPGMAIRQYTWPVIVIGIGLLVVFWPRNKKNLGWGGGDKNEGPKGDGYSQAGAYGTTESFEDASTASEAVTDIPGDKNVSFEEVLDVTAVFGGIKKNVVSKAFKGGEIVSIFGGSEINLTRADFNKEIRIEAVQIFGGTTLIIPPNWQIRSESVAIFGGIDDKRTNLSDNPDKVLILEGFTLFGGIEIKSY